MVNTLVLDYGYALALAPNSLYFPHDNAQTWQILPTTDGKIPLAVCAASQIWTGYMLGKSI